MEDDKAKQGFSFNAGALEHLKSGVIESLCVDFLNDAACRKFILETLHASSARCPSCGAGLQSCVRITAFWDGRRVKCGSCKKEFTALTGTCFSGCHWSYSEIFLLLVLLGLGIHDAHIASVLRCRVETIRKWKKL